MQVGAVTPASRLNPVFAIDGEHYSLQTPLMFAIPLDRLSPPLLSLADGDFEILAAIDMLWSGV
jgi:toxin CcdB